MLPRHRARVAPERILFLWADAFRLCRGDHLQVADVLPCVDLIAWNNGRFGMGYRSRRCGDYLLILQKPPIRAKATWRDHGIRDRWVEKVDTRIHPHIKPAGLIRRLIAAVTAPGDLIIDPAAGSFSSCMSHTNSVAALEAAISVKPRRPPNDDETVTL